MLLKLIDRLEMFLYELPVKGCKGGFCRKSEKMYL